jgi:hypothetical protein
VTLGISAAFLTNREGESWALWHRMKLGPGRPACQGTGISGADPLPQREPSMRVHREELSSVAEPCIGHS